MSSLSAEQTVRTTIAHGRACKLVRCCAPLLLAFALPAHAQITVPSGGSLGVPAGGSLGLACTALNVLGSMQVGSGQVDEASSVDIAAGGTLDGGSGTITVSGDWSNSGTFVAGSGTVVLTDTCSNSPTTLSGASVFNNLTLSSSNGHTFVIPAGTNLTVNGILTLQGTTNLPIQLVSSSGQPAIIALGPQATVVGANTAASNNVQIGSQAMQPIPTLGEWAMIVLASLVAALPLALRRRLPKLA